MTDGHWPVWERLPALRNMAVIRCECGATPKKTPARMSTQHVWHQTHRRGLRLQPVEYVWSDEAWDAVHATPGEPRTSTGGYVICTNAVWSDGGWVRTTPTATKER